MRWLRRTDPDVARALRAEARRQRDQLVLIASENSTSRAVLEATGSVLTNKYAEGYPGRRYYGGCEQADTVETLAQERAKALFGAEHVNVQPHSGAQANMAVYFALLKPGDTILGMNLAQGGHLTHGAPVSFSGTLYRPVFYGVGRESGLIDYDEVLAQAQAHRPRLIIAGGSAYPRIIDFKKFREAADACGALLMVDMAHPAGLIAAGVHPSPVPWADVVTTTTHKTLRGPRGGMILCRAPYAPAVDKAVFPGIQGGPLMHVIAAKAVALREAQTPEFQAYQRQVVANARALASALLTRGYRLISGGTDTHLVLVDLTPTGLTGKEAEALLGAVGAVVNKNAIPYDTRPPAVASGIRLGSPTVTTRGMREKEMEEIADVIHLALARPRARGVARQLRARVRALCRQFPV